MIWITTEQVIKLHTKIIGKTGGIDGVRDKGRIESAIMAPLQSFGNVDLYTSVTEKIARAGYGLTVNHSFIDGNKRIGLLVTQILLMKNGFELVASDDELVNMFLDIASGKINYDSFMQWIEKHLA